METDKIITLPLGIILRINGISFTVSQTKIQKGDMLYDRSDGTYGICDMIKDDLVAIKDEDVVELAVPISRVYKLVRFNIYNN